MAQSPETLDGALPDEVLKQAKEVLALARDKGLYLATAESCTGGLLAALLTDVPGCSHVFERGFVVYSEDAKCDLLGIAREKVESCGAVSEAVVHFACARHNGETCHREAHFGPVGRQGVRIEALRVALDMIADALKA